MLLPVDETLPAAEIAELGRAFRPAAVLTAPEGAIRVRIGSEPSARLCAPGAAMIRLTSGTTGRPRGALISPAQAIADHRALATVTRLRERDTNVAAVPLNHAYGFNAVVLPLFLAGTPAVLMRRPLPGVIFRALRSMRPLRLWAVPYLLDLLARHPGTSPRRLVRRLCVSAGAPLAGRTAKAFHARFGIGVKILYGATEVGGITFDAEEDAGLVEGRVGRPMPGVHLRLDRAGLSRLPAGQGRIVVSGPAAGSGYLPEGSPDLERGMFKTSDLGAFDEEGRLHLTGRLSSLVNVSGRKVNPAEVERALLGLDGVIDAVAMGVADALRGERLEAWVVARAGALEIRSALARSLPEYKIPRSIRIVTAIPRTARGKIDRSTILKLR